MKTSFETLIEPDNQKAIVNIKQNNNVIIRNVHLIYYLKLFYLYVKKQCSVQFYVIIK